MKRSFASRVPQRLSKTGSVNLGQTFLQQWWVVEKCVESPESDRVFCHVVGVIRQKTPELKLPYRQTPVTVIVESLRARGGIATNWKRLEFSYLKLSPIDFEHKVFPGWD